MAAEVGSIYIGLTADLSNVIADFERTGKVVDRFAQGAAKSCSVTALAFDFASTKASMFSGRLGFLGTAMRSFGPAGLALAGGLGGAAIAFDKLANHAEEFAKKLGEMKDAAKVIGLTTDQFQALRGAGKDFGVTGDQIATAVGRFSVEMDSLRHGGGELLEQIRRIDPALADQLAATKNNATALDLYARAWSAAAEAQKNALSRAGFGKSGLDVGQVLGVVNNAGGLDALATRARETGRIIQGDVIDRLDELQKQIDRTRNATGKNFNLIFSENALRHDLEIAQDLEKISEILRDFKPSAAWQQFLDWLTKPVDATQAALSRIEDTIRYSRQAPVGGIIGNQASPQPHSGGTTFDTVVQTTNIPLPPTRPNIPAPASSPSAEYQYRQYQQLIAVLGQAVTPSEQLKLKQLELAAAIERGGISTSVTARAMEAYRLSLDQQNVALRERLGVATAEERMAIKERELDQLVRSGTLSVQDRAKALEIYRRELAETMKYEPLKLSDTPNLTKLAIDARDLRATLDQQLTNALQAIPNELISIADGSEKARAGLNNLTLAMLRAIAQAVLMRSVVSPLASTISGFFGVAPTVGEAGTISNGGAFGPGVQKHDGGTFWDASPRRYLPLRGWGPRLHSGLSSNEYRAVLDKSEHVLTSPQIRRTANALGGLAAAAVNSGNGGGVELHFHNAPRVASRTESDNGNGGRRMDITFERQIDSKMAAIIGSGRSQTNKALEGRYGLDRTKGSAG